MQALVARCSRYRPRAPCLIALVVTAAAVTATLPLQRTFDRFPYCRYSLQP
jgi:hypothetical protein